MAVINPNGTIEIGLTIVTSPGGTPVHVDTTIDLATLGGPWRDSLGGTGAFVFTPAGAASGNPRPLATVAVPDGAITRPKLADGAVNALKIDATEVQRRVQGTCPSGELMIGVTESGGVTCEAVSSGAGGDITGVSAGAGLSGGAATGDATVAADFSQVQARVAAACPANETIRAINADGTVVCDVDNNSGGDIDAVTAGTGLIGGGDTGAVTLSVQFGGTGTVNSAARSNHTHAIAGQNNTSIGEEALGSAAASANLTAVGYRALRSNMSGQGTTNTAIGSRALEQNTSGSSNVALGASALGASRTGNDNTALGQSALNNATITHRNTAVGAGSLILLTFGNDNTAVGYRAGAGGGPGNTAVGSLALSAGEQTLRNTAAGAFALQLATGDNNTALGTGALESLVDGSDNVAIGEQAGRQLTAGSNNLYLDSLSANAEDNTIRIGKSIHDRTFIAAVRGVTTGFDNGQAVVIDTAGQLGTISSSRRTKFDIADLPSPVTAALQSLRPVQFRYLQAFADGSIPLQYGLVAEEVQEVLPALVATDAEGAPASVKYHVLPALLLADVQRLERERLALEEVVARQHGDLTELRAELAAVRAMVAAIEAGRSR
jgi:hypothetical protein